MAAACHGTSSSVIRNYDALLVLNKQFCIMIKNDVLILVSVGVLVTALPLIRINRTLVTVVPSVFIACRCSCLTKEWRRLSREPASSRQYSL